MKSQLHIETCLKNNRTVLLKSYATPPFKVVDISEDKRDPCLRLMLMSSSPGILDGDEYDIEIILREKSVLHLQTQSFQRLFQMDTGAVQVQRICLENGSSLHYLPHPIVPHEQSVFFSNNQIHLEANCSLLLGEIITCGRQLNGEIFKLSRVHSLTEIYYKNKLVIRENLLIEPSVSGVGVLGQLEGFTHQAGLMFINDRVEVKELNLFIHKIFDGISDIEYGISAAPVNGIIVRILGRKAEQLQVLLEKIAELIQSFSQTTLIANAS